MKEPKSNWMHSKNDKMLKQKSFITNSALASVSCEIEIGSYGKYTVYKKKR